MKIYKSVCPYDCPDACGLLIYVENGRVVKVAGDPGMCQEVLGECIDLDNS
jgi:anaerobic selenocysteine-containing dehydrogenase